jgi:hypothetical protein
VTLHLVVILMPLVCSNSGNSCSYTPVNPPDIRTFTAPLDIVVNLLFDGAVSTTSNAEQSVRSGRPTAGLFGEFARDQAREQIGRSASSETDDHLHRSNRPILGPCLGHGVGGAQDFDRPLVG